MARPPAPLTQQPLAEVLEQLAEHTPGPGGGAAAALAVALAAALVEMTAKYDESILAQARLVRANALRTRALEQADIERDVYQAVIAAIQSLGEKFAMTMNSVISRGYVRETAINLAEWPDISFVMQGADGSDVTLTCAPSTYWQTDAPQKGYVVFQINKSTLPIAILGLPLFNNYYTVFDRTQNPYGTINFAPIAAPPAS